MKSSVSPFLNSKVENRHLTLLAFLVTLFYIVCRVLLEKKLSITSLFDFYATPYFLGVSLLAILLSYFRKTIYLYIIPLSLVIIGGKLGALFGLSVYFLGSASLGATIYSFFSRKVFRTLPTQIMPIQLMLCFWLLIGIGINAIIQWFLLKYQIHYQSTYYIYFGLQSLLFLPSLTRVIGKPEKEQLLETLTGTSLLPMWLSLCVVYALVPHYVFEDLNSYFFIPKQLFLYHKYEISEKFIPSVMPNYAHLQTYNAPFLLGGEFAIRLELLFFQFFGHSILYSFLRSRNGPKVAYWGLLAAITCPLLFAELTGVFSDSLDYFLGCLGLGFFWLSMPSFSLLNVASLALIFSIGLTFRLQAMVGLAPLVLFAFLRFALSEIKTSPKKVIIAAGVCGAFPVAFMAPGLLRGYLNTGNPFFPFLSHIFKSPHFYTDDIIGNSLGQIPPLEKVFRQLFFHGTVRHFYLEFHDYQFGFFLYASILPGLLLLLRRQKEEMKTYLGFLFLYLFTSLVIFHSIFHQIRYFTSALAAIFAFYGLVIHNLTTDFEWKKPLKYTVGSVISIIAIITITTSLSYELKPLPYPLAALFLDNFSSTTLWSGQKKFFQYANARTTTDSRALLYYSPANYFADFKIEPYDWYSFKTQEAILKVKDKPKELYHTLFRDLGFNYLLINNPNPFNLVREGMIQASHTEGGFSFFEKTQLIRLDNEYAFDDQNINRGMLLNGWSLPEGHAIWNEDKSSSLRIRIPEEENGKYLFKVKIAPTNAKEREFSRPASILVNGLPLKNVPGADPTTMEIPLLKTAKNRGDFVITFNWESSNLKRIMLQRFSIASLHQPELSQVDVQ